MTTPAAPRRTALAGLLVALACAAGCGEREGSVTGRVTFRDAPLRGGAVILFCEGQQIAHGAIDQDGRYEIPRVPLGPARATVRVPAPVKELLRHRVPFPPVHNGPVGLNKQSPGAAAKIPPIPPRYEVPEESGLTLTVGAGETVFDIALADK